MTPPRALGRGRSAPPPQRPFWDALGADERTALQAVGRLRIYPGRSPLVHQGDESDHAIVILEGWTKVTSARPDGREVLLAVRGAGDLVGESAVLGGRSRSATVTALNTVEALVLPAGRFIQFLDAHPATWRLVSSLFVQRLDAADHRLTAHVSTHSSQRLALLLADLAELSAYHQPPDPDGAIEIGPPLSQEELGSWTDASRETVARSLGELRRRGLIRTGWRRITVLDVTGLREYASEP
ncbi:Crp/Fnr family transcriptional regulator [Actinomadura kijaniata]|uniref:Crp/Fnr family transcriptional regulator n=1 Tax=Actinomadura kijaniata TaxID=46161 RepID=UPI003F1D7AEE